VVVISHRFWRNLFGAARGVIGRNIPLNGEPYTVVGVLPEESAFARQSADLWAPPDSGD
jgi:putative ABC transport system permease protein